MNVPDDLNYSATDEWLRLDGANATVGLTDHAQRQLGEVSGVTLPEVGVQVVAGDAIARVHAALGDREVCAPISGTIIAINEALTGTPRLINSEPYSAGWIFRISVEAGEEIEPLASAAQYAERIGGGGSAPLAMDL